MFTWLDTVELDFGLLAGSYLRVPAPQWGCTAFSQPSGPMEAAGEVAQALLSVLNTCSAHTELLQGGALDAAQRNYRRKVCS